MVVVIVMIMLLYVDMMMIYIISRYVPCFVKHCHGNLNSGIVLLHQVSKYFTLPISRPFHFQEKLNVFFLLIK